MGRVLQAEKITGAKTLRQVYFSDSKEAEWLEQLPQ